MIADKQATESLANDGRIKGKQMRSTMLMLSISIAVLYVICKLGDNLRKDFGPYLLEEEPIRKNDIQNLEKKSEICLPRGHGDPSWVGNQRSGLQKLNDSDFLDCAALRFHKSLQVDGPRSALRTNDKKPLAIIHVGPRKTGSSSIQRAIKEKYSEDLRIENYVSIVSNHHAFTHCLARNEIRDDWLSKCEKFSEVLDGFKATIGDARAKNANILISNESFDQTGFINVTQIQELFSGFDVHVIVTYRRFFEWMVSKFGQMYRHSPDWRQWDALGDKTNNIVSSSSRKDIKKLYSAHYSLEVYRMYADAGFQTHMLNFHANSNVVKSFFCLDVLNTPTICKKETESETTTRANEKETIAFDEIVVAAQESGILDGTKLTRVEAREAVQAYFEQTLGQTEADLPKVCIQQRELNLLERVSVMSESLAVPNFYSRVGQQELLTRFESYKTEGFCSVDTAIVLNEHSGSIRSIFSAHE